MNKVLVNKICWILLAFGLISLNCSDKENGGSGNPLDPDPMPVETIIKKNGTISEAENWSETNTDTSVIVYRINKNCSIESDVKWEKGIRVSIDSSVVVKIRKNGVLSIDEGVKISIGKGAYFDVGAETRGTLIASGSENSPIQFRPGVKDIKWGLKSSDSQAGGIILGDYAVGIKLNYCSITGARAGIYVKSGVPVITNCQIKDCSGTGVYFDSTESSNDSLTFKNNTISDCGGYPLVLPAYKLGNLSSKNSFAKDDSEKNAICVLGGCVADTSAVWEKMDIPYVFSGRTIIGSDKSAMVTIKPGTICKFEKDASLRVGDPGFGVGVLIAKGTKTDSIYFINNVSDEFWGGADMYTGGVYGIWVGLEAPENTAFEYCSIKNAVNGIGIVSVVPRVTISNCLITGCDSNGVVFLGGGIVDSLSFMNNIFTQNGEYGIRIAADQLVNISGSISVNNNGKDGIYVNGASVAASGVWKNCGVPYIVDGQISIESSGGAEKITIDPGTEFRFLKNSGISVGYSSPGTLIAKGTESKPIVFTSYKENEPWGIERDDITCGVRIEEHADSKTELRYCNISTASSGAYINASVKVKNCKFTDCRDYGLIYGKKSDSELISDNTFSDNGEDEFKIE
ncbi:MAG: right-handed parallel beta-helix repeat-containing protein [Fibrobacter sp.]|nr:right-handed parallel beta-helix repeat-containing protein [Fibrobacter sp.]